MKFVDAKRVLIDIFGKDAQLTREGNRYTVRAGDKMLAQAATYQQALLTALYGAAVEFATEGNELLVRIQKAPPAPKTENETSEPEAA